MGRMLDALDRDGFNAVGYSLGGLVKALDGSGAAPVRDLTGGVNKFVEFDRLQADIEAVIGKNMSENVFAETYASLLGPAFSTAAEIAETFAAAELSTAFPETDLGRDFANIARIIAQRDALGLERGAYVGRRPELPSNKHTHSWTRKTTRFTGAGSTWTSAASTTTTRSRRSRGASRSSTTPSRRSRRS
jgi:hypothetical protein